MKSRLLAIAALGEAATGLVLLAYPPIVIWLLFGVEIIGAGIVMSRITGIALIALGVACWSREMSSRALCGMLTYSTLAMLYLVYVGAAGELTGILLWPAVIVHAVLSVLLARSWFKAQENITNSFGVLSPIFHPCFARDARTTTAGVTAVPAVELDRWRVCASIQIFRRFAASYRCNHLTI